MSGLSSPLWAFLLLLLANLTSGLSLTSELSACSACTCLGESSSSAVRLRTLHCSDQMELTISNLPPTFRAIEVTNVTHLRMERKALQTETLLLVSLRNVSQLLLEAKSLVLLDSSSRIELNITDCYHVELEPRAVSAEAGDLFVSVQGVDTLKIAGQAFDVLQRVDLRNIRSLLLNPLSFKPNVLWNEMADLEVSIEGVEELPVLPSGVFSSTKTIEFKDCNIKEIRGKSFSGNQVDRISFDSCSIDRLHSNAFSELLLLGNLSFHRCHLQAVSERAVRSAVTTLTLSETSIATLSQSAFKPSMVVGVNLLRNDFQTLGDRSLVFHSWNQVQITGNIFRFLEEGAFLGFETESDGAKRSFTFTDNVIRFANMGSLKHALPDSISVTVSNNTFHRECDCDILSWLDMMAHSPGDNLVESGDDDEDLADVIGLLQNTSACAVPDFQAACFADKSVVIPAYRERLCQPRKEGENAPSVEAKDMCVSSHLEIWRHFSDHVEISKTKGILLVILLFALFVSLVLSIYTLLRWIVYTLQIRHHQLKNEEEWNFTKVEERRMTPEACLVSPEDHYERLPFMNEEPELEEEEEAAGPATTTTTVKKDRDLEGGAKPKLRGGADRKEQLSDSQRNSLQPPKMSEEPQMTFYDEMIDLLKEKLEDPDNYGTVADSTLGGAAALNRSSVTSDTKSKAEPELIEQDQLLYQDPLEANKKSDL